LNYEETLLPGEFLSLMACEIQAKLTLLSTSLEKEQAYQALKTLRTILNNVKTEPGNEKFRQLRAANKTFNGKLWVHAAARDVMRILGWTESGDLVVLKEFNEGDVEITLTLLSDLIEEPPVNGTSCPRTEQNGPPQKQTTHSPGGVNLEHQKQMEFLKEQRRKTEEEKRRIAAQIQADRQEASTRETKPSHAREIKFGSNVARFKDIGVDLNKGGG
jgi:hypothetical protein